MKPEPSIFDELDAATDAAADREGVADLDAGRVVSHERMKAWLLSWRNPSERLSPSKRGVRQLD